MAITPYTTPVQFEYRPLNLSAFAVPLAKMQEQFDLTQAEIEASDFDLAHLPYGTDPERAKELIATVRAKRDELAKNLLETKNYKQAAVKLKQLNDLWKKDPELNALQANYKLWQERDKEERERVNKGELTREQYLQWQRDEREKYKEAKGASFTADHDNPTGTYNVITGSVGRLKDLSDELEKTRIEIAKLNPEKVSTFFKQNIPSMTESERVSLEQKITGKTAEEIARETEIYLRQIPKFKAWAEEVAMYDFLDASKRGEDLTTVGKPLLENTKSSIDSTIAQEIAKDPNFKQTERYKDLMDTKEEIDNMLATGEYNPNYVKALYTQQHLNKVYNSQAIADILAYRNVENNYSIRKNYEWEQAQKAAENAATALGGGFDPNTYENLNLDNLVTQRVSNAKALLPSVKLLNDIAGGTFRTLTNGWRGSEFRKEVEKNPALLRERQEKIIEIAAVSKNAEEFHRKLWQAGIREGNSKQTAAAVFKSLQDPTTMNFAVRELESNRSTYQNYLDARSQLENIDKHALENKEFIQVVNTVGKTQTEVSDEELKQIAIKLKVPLAKFDNGVFNARATAEKLRAKGYNVQSSYTPEGRDMFYVGMNEIAQSRGFKNLQEALKAGEDFSNYSAYRTLKSAKQKLIDEGTLNVRDMGYRYNNDPKFDKALSGMFLNVSDVTSFTPATTNDWNNVPGFDSNSETGTKPGTKLLIGGNSNVKLVSQGNRMLLEIPYSYKEGNEEKQATVLVDFKTGSQEKKRYILNVLKARNAGDSGYNQQTLAMLSKMTFDTEVPNTLSESSVKIATVTKDDQEAVLKTIPGENPGVSYQIVKKYVNEDTPPTIMIKIVNDAGKSQYITTESGKIFSTNSIDQAKVFIAENIFGW